MKVYEILQVSVVKQSETPLTIVINVFGRASSSGWTHALLDPSGDPNPADNVFEYSFEATPPAGISLPMLSPISASVVLTPDRSVDAVIISARRNTVTVHASEFLSASGATAATATPAITNPLIDDPATLPGLEGTTRRLGEHWPTTFVVGEEGPWITTFALGEEGGRPTTLVVGEEGGTDPRLDDPASPQGGAAGPFGQF